MIMFLKKEKKQFSGRKYGKLMVLQDTVILPIYVEGVEHNTTMSFVMYGETKAIYWRKRWLMQ